MEMLTVLIMMVLIATLVSLGWGLASMSHGGSYDAKHSEQLMNARVGLQGLAVVLLFIGLMLSVY